MSFAVTLQVSRVSDFRFFSDLRCCNPALVIREFETLKETSWVNPALKAVMREHIGENLQKGRKFIVENKTYFPLFFFWARQIWEQNYYTYDYSWISIHTNSKARVHTKPLSRYSSYIVTHHNQRDELLVPSKSEIYLDETLVQNRRIRKLFPYIQNPSMVI